MFEGGAPPELEPGHRYVVELVMRYLGAAASLPMETVWGEAGMMEGTGDGDLSNTRLSFMRVEREGMRSSVNTGQLPLLHYCS